MSDKELMENLSPEDIAQFKEGFQLAKQLIYQPQTTEALIADVEQRGVQEAVAGSLVMVLQKVQESTGPFSLGVAAALGMALIDDIFDFLEQAGMAENSQELQQAAFESAVAQWLSLNNIPREQLAQELQASGAPEEVMQQLMPQSDPAPAPAPNSDIMQRV